jgi:hypothetical protein
MVRPIAYVVLEEGNIMDLIFRFDISMLCDADIDTYARWVAMEKGNTGILECSVGTVNADAPGACTVFNGFFALVACGIEVADSSRSLSHVTQVQCLDTSMAFEEIVSEFGQSVSVGSRKANACDDNTFFSGHCFGMERKFFPPAILRDG